MPLQALDIEHLESTYSDDDSITDALFQEAKTLFDDNLLSSLAAVYDFDNPGLSVDMFLPKRFARADHDKTGFEKLLAVLTYPGKNNNYQSYKFKLASVMFGVDTVNAALRGENKNAAAKTIVQTLIVWVKMKIALQEDDPNTTNIQLAALLLDQAVGFGVEHAITFLLAAGANPAYIEDELARRIVCRVLLAKHTTEASLTLIHTNEALIPRWIDAAIAVNRYDIVSLIVSQHPEFAAQAGFVYTPPDENIIPEPDPNAASTSTSTANPATTEDAPQWLDVSPLDTPDAAHVEQIFRDACQYWTGFWSKHSEDDAIARMPREITDDNCFQKLYVFFDTDTGSKKVNSLMFAVIRAALGDEPVTQLLASLSMNRKEDNVAAELIASFTAWLKVKAMREQKDPTYFNGEGGDTNMVVGSNTLYADIERALIRRDTQTAYLLYREGAHPDQLYQHGIHHSTTCLSVATVYGLDIVDVVLSDPNYQPMETISEAIKKAFSQRRTMSLIDRLIDKAESANLLVENRALVEYCLREYIRKWQPSLRTLSLLLQHAKTLEIDNLQNTLNECLYTAIQGNQHKIIAILLHHGANPHARITHSTQKTITPFAWAVKKIAQQGKICAGRTNITYNMLLHDQRYPLNETIVYSLIVVLKIRRENPELCLSLIDRATDAGIFNVDPDDHPLNTIKDHQGQTALCIAINNWHWEIAEKLVELGADPRLDQTVLDKALLKGARGTDAAMQILVRIGANPFWTDNNGDSAINQAARYQNERFDILLQTTHTPTETIGKTLLIAAGANKPELVLALAESAQAAGLFNEHPELLNTTSRSNKTVLHCAKRHHWDNNVILELITYGANPDFANIHNKTFLSYAAKDSISILFNDIIENKGYRITEHTKDTIALLIKQFDQSYAYIAIQQLLHKAQTQDGACEILFSDGRLLLEAAKTKNSICVTLLMSHGASADALLPEYLRVEPYGLTPLSAAQGLNYGARGKKELSAAQTMLEFINTNEQPQSEHIVYAMMQAIEKKDDGHERLSNLLKLAETQGLFTGDNNLLNTVHVDSISVLYVAVKHRKEQFMQTLLAYGADPLVKHGDKKSPIRRALDLDAESNAILTTLIVAAAKLHPVELPGPLAPAVTTATTSTAAIEDDSVSNSSSSDDSDYDLPSNLDVLASMATWPGKVERKLQMFEHYFMQSSADEPMITHHDIADLVRHFGEESPESVFLKKAQLVKGDAEAERLAVAAKPDLDLAAPSVMSSNGAALLGRRGSSSGSDDGEAADTGDSLGEGGSKVKKMKDKDKDRLERFDNDLFGL